MKKALCRWRKALFCSERENYSAFGLVIAIGGALQIKSPVRCAHNSLFPFCPHESRLSASKMKKALQSPKANCGLFFVARGRIELPTS